MMDLFFVLTDNATLAAITTDRALVEISRIVSGILGIMFLFAMVSLGWAKSIVGIITTVVIFGILMAFAIDPLQAGEIGIWLVGLFTR